MRAVTPLSVSLQRVCQEPKTITPRNVTDSDGKKRHITEINVKLIYEALINNLGAPGLNRIIAALSMPPISQGKFDRYARYLYKRMESHHENMMKKGIDAVVQHYRNTGVELNAATGYLDIAISFDGTWQKRGHTSHIGVSFVVEIETGMVIDFEVLCNFCQVCSKKNMSAKWIPVPFLQSYAHNKMRKTRCRT